ncbi:kelch repeat containing protein [Babesia divergens]|uniref:Kelch repeat containing protein n=1 Tax=Babesia divergens TaxID=32595 RepID=A0AAD9G7A5_BABDI|nr:kelch repeat containing protein [Babesia divergens]
MTKKKSEAKAKLVASKCEKQERKARKKLLKSTKEEDISHIIKKWRYKREDAECGRLVDFEGGRPTPRASATFTLSQGDTGILFGGEFYDGVQVEVFNDAYFYSVSKHEWKLLQTNVKPPPRCAHQATIYNNYLYIFGGEYSTLNQFHHFNDMHRLCLKSLKWEPVEATGNLPSARSGHRMVTWKGYWVLFGGFHDTTREITYYNDLYLFSFKDCTWKRACQQRFIGALPDPRAACLMLAQKNSNRILVFGGFTKTKDNDKNVTGQYHQDSWIINMDLAIQGDTLFWEKVNTKGKPTYSIGFGLSNYKGFGVVAGGVSDMDTGGTSLKSTFYNNCFLLNIEQKRWYPLTVNQSAPRTDGDEISDLLADKMDKVSLSPTPCPRMNPHVIVSGNSLYVYGGIVEQGSVEVTLSDMWLFDLGKRDGWKCIDEGFNFRELYKGEMDMEEDSASDSGDSECDEEDYSASDDESDTNEETDDELGTSV